MTHHTIALASQLTAYPCQTHTIPLLATQKHTFSLITRKILLLLLCHTQTHTPSPSYSWWHYPPKPTSVHIRITTVQSQPTSQAVTMVHTKWHVWHRSFNTNNPWTPPPTLSLSPLLHTDTSHHTIMSFHDINGTSGNPATAHLYTSLPNHICAHTYRPDKSQPLTDTPLVFSQGLLHAHSSSLFLSSAWTTPSEQWQKLLLSLRALCAWIESGLIHEVHFSHGTIFTLHQQAQDHSEVHQIYSKPTTHFYSTTGCCQTTSVNSFQLHTCRWWQHSLHLGSSCHYFNAPGKPHLHHHHWPPVTFTTELTCV